MHDRVFARLTIDDAGEMSEKGRREIADWLRIQADNLELEGADYSNKFVARYIATVKDEDDAQKELTFG